MDGNVQSAHEGTSGAGWATMILPMLEQGPLYSSFQADLSLLHPANADFCSAILPSMQCPSDPKPDTWRMEEEGTGDFLIELPTANYAGVFGTFELHDCENAPGDFPVTGTGQCRSDGTFYHNSRVRLRDLTDGTTTTLILGERRTDIPRGWFTTWVGMIPEGEEAFQRILGSADHVPNHPAAHFDDFSSWHVGGAQFCLGDGSVHFISENIDEGVYKALATIQNGEVIGEF